MPKATTTCSHLDAITDVKAQSDTCPECQAQGTQAVALRLCLTCGHVGCCDSSVGRHARAHFAQTGHPIIESFKSAGGNEWRFCYIDNDYL